MDLRHALSVANWFPHGTNLWLAGLLHDAIEDGDLTGEEMLRLGIPLEVVRTVEVVTRANDESYFDYIERICGTEKGSAARLVKDADLRENLRRMDPEHGTLRGRYVGALKRLGVRS